MQPLSSSEKAKMEAAYILIKEQRYIEARALLRGISHPKARQWTQKINSILAEDYPEFSSASVNDILKKTERKSGCLTHLSGFTKAALVLIVLLFCLVTIVPSTSPKPMTNQEAADHIANSVGISAGGRDIDEIYYSAGEVSVSYFSRAFTEAEIADEWLDIFDAVADSKNNRFTINNVTIFMGSPLGEALATVSVDFNTLQRYHTNQISRAEFLSRIDVITF